MPKKGDYILVKNLFAKSVVGLDAWKRSIAQPLRINLGINVGSRLKRMRLSDDLRRTLNYDLLSTKIISQIESQHFQDAEELANSVGKTIQSELSTGEFSFVEISQTKARLLTQSRNTTVNSKNGTVLEGISGLRLPTIIGVNELERIHPQIVELDVEVERKSLSEVFTHEYLEELSQACQESRYLTIESYANAVAERLCSHESVLRAVVTAGKPSALNFADAAQIRIERESEELSRYRHKNLNGNVVYIAFGTNQGETIANIQRCTSELEKSGIKVLQTSGIYMSEPMYYTEQPPFFNGVFRCSTDLRPEELLKKLKEIEYGTFGRVKKFDNGPRTMDLDILLYNNETVDLDNLKVPHIDMLNRSFVLKPLNDVIPGSTASQPVFPEEKALEGTEKQIIPLFWNPTVSDANSSKFLEVSVQTAIMAIMNATTDSFSDGGDLLEKNIAHVAAKHIADGALILDVGGQSTRPGAEWIGIEEETRRLCSAIKEIRSSEASRNAIISIDTCWGSAAQAGLDAGANIINDVFSGVMDPTILEVAAKSGAPIILSHARGDPKTMSKLTEYPGGLIEDIAYELRQRIDAALAAGCKAWQIILDPGLGFAKTAEQNIELIRRFSELKAASALTDGLPSLPWLVGPSRKGFIGSLTNEAEPKNRVIGTTAVVTALRRQGVEIVRVHDVKPTWQALQVANAIYK